MDVAQKSQIRKPSVDLGDKIQQRRISLRLSQDDLASRLGVTRQTISNWECGKTTPDAVALSRIATCLGTSADGLLGDDIPRFRDRSTSTRRELLTVGAILFAIQAISGFYSGLHTANIPLSGTATFEAFRWGTLLVTIAWLFSIKKRAGFQSVRELSRFASLSPRSANEKISGALSFACRHFWTCYFGLFTAMASFGTLIGIAYGSTQISHLWANVLMFGFVTAVWAWELDLGKRQG